MKNMLLIYVIIICTSYVHMPIYAMDSEYKQLENKAVGIIKSIDEGIASEKLTSEQKIRQCLEQQLESCSKDDTSRKRISGFCVSRYRDRVNKLPLLFALHERPQFYVSWKDGKPDQACMVSDADSSMALIWHKHNKWRKNSVYALNESEKDKKITFVQLLGDRLALGVYKNTDHSDAWLRIYEKASSQDRRYTDNPLWKRREKIRIVGGDLMSCAVTDDMQYCAMLINIISTKKIELKLFKRRSGSPYDFVWGKYIDNGREIIAMTPSDITIRSNTALFTVDTSNVKVASQTVTTPYESPRSVTRLIAHTLYQKHLEKQTASANRASVTSVPANTTTTTTTTTITAPPAAPVNYDDSDGQESLDAEDYDDSFNKIIGNLSALLDADDDDE